MSKRAKELLDKLEALHRDAVDDFVALAEEMDGLIELAGQGNEARAELEELEGEREREEEHSATLLDACERLHELEAREHPDRHQMGFRACSDPDCTERRHALGLRP